MNTKETLSPGFLAQASSALGCSAEDVQLIADCGFLITIDSFSDAQAGFRQRGASITIERARCFLSSTVHSENVDVTDNVLRLVSALRSYQKECAMDIQTTKIERIAITCDMAKRQEAMDYAHDNGYLVTCQGPASKGICIVDPKVFSLVAEKEV